MNPFFENCLKHFSESQSPELAESTKDGKKRQVTHLLDYLESHGIGDFSSFKIGIIYEFITSLSFASQTINGLQFTIREFFDILYEKGIAPVDGRQIFPVIFTNKRDRIISS